MRALALLLILANILFFGWSQLIDGRVSSLDRQSSANAAPPPKLVLARESTTTPEPRVVTDIQPPRVEPVAPQATPTPVDVARTDPNSCSSVGPFAELSEAAQAQAALRSEGLRPRQRVEQGELWVGYWVSVQNLPARDTAERALKTLSDNGITDVYLMPGSDPANVLSLGVFSDYQRAQRRAEEIRALGFEPRIDDRKRAGSVYWVDVDLTELGQTINMSIFAPGPGKIMRLELRGCPASAVRG
jgi:hypothetical protein